MNVFRTSVLLSPLEKRERKEHLIDALTTMYHADTVNIRLDSIMELYSHFDPAKLEQRALNADAEAFLMDELGHFAHRSHVQVNIMVPRLEGVDADSVRRSFENHFRTKAEEQLIINTKATNRWLRNLAWGSVFLAASLLSAHLLGVHSAEHSFFSVLSESLSIIGWVALWEPASYFLYGRQEGKRTLRHYMRLHRATVSVIEVDEIRL